MRVLLLVIASKRLLSAPVVLVAAVIVFWFALPAQLGWAAGSADVALGHYRLLTYGLPSPILPAFRQTMRESYGVEVRAVAGCDLTSSIASYNAAYNAVSRAAIHRKFGRDVVAETWDRQRLQFRRGRVRTGVTPQRHS